MKKIALGGGLRTGGRVTDASRVVKYTPCTRQDIQPDDDNLDEIAVVSNAAPENVKYGAGGSLTANGPRVVPGIITSAGGERLDRRSASSTRIHTSSPMYSTRSSENLKSASRQSLLETVAGKLHPHHRGSTDTAASVRARSSLAYINRAHISSDLEIPKKTRELRRKEIKKEFEKWETSTSASDRSRCKWTFVFDPSGRLCYYWSMVVSVAFLYNFWVIIYRFSFREISESSIYMWFALDYLADLIYILDILFHFRTGYLEEGVLQTDSEKLRAHYMNSTMFYIDALCLLPLDFLYLSIGFNSILRCFRLVKIYRFWAFLDRTERHTNYPNVFRAVNLTHYVLVIFHWNACLSHIISTTDGFGSIGWFRSSACDNTDVLCEYLHAFYWSTLALTTIGDLPRPRTKGEYLFLVVQIVLGLFLFAAVLGHVANIVTNVSAARKEFQAKLDAVKTYMRMRHVPEHLQNKVIKWFDYLWLTQKSSDEERSVGCLPDKLKAEIAIHVHLDTLKRVEIFQNTEAGFLCELVLRLRPVLFSPGDYICRKGEVGKEMYIVNRGRLQVVTDNGKTVLATLRAGSYFGEISILNMGTAGNRRTASVRSVGYSDLFCLYKQDMWDVLKDYPAARVRLEAIAVKRLEKYKRDPMRKSRLFFPCGVRPISPFGSEAGLLGASATGEDDLARVALGRSRSTPGLVESRGKMALEEMNVPPQKEASSSAATLLTSSDNQPTSLLHHHLHSPHTSETQHAAPPSSAPSLQQASFAHPVQTTSVHMNPFPNMDHRRCFPPTITSVGAPFYSHPEPSVPMEYPVSPPGSENYLGSSPASTTHLLVPSPLLGVSSAGPSPLGAHTPTREASQEALLAEIKRLRERLVTLETENATMSVKLSQQQWEVESRLAEIELQICGNTGSPVSISSDEFERNKESII
ncbi:cyclic nucleotide-gated channel rod photoreceptor subunit alpha-like [Ornithodoros turicata]|uniref:cyclic nucleotide-gated channel rod photoreceptor subunit alpha-like n=1 Tax=Ornithodoros turicata TaxID=34597 RepID=UPI003138B84A